MRLRLCLLGVLFLLCSLPCFLFASDYDLNLPDQTEEEGKTSQDSGEKTLTAEEVFTYFQQMAQVSAASKVAQTVFEVPASTVSVSNTEFLNFGYLTLNQAIYQQAGFFYAQGTERRTIGSRGYFEDWNNTHYLHLVDGIPFNDNADGSAHTWEATPVIFIKNLEIVRGPGSALYGSNATNGVISVTTFSGNDLKGQSDLRLRYGGMNTLRFEFLTGDATESYQYMVAFHRHTTSGNDQVMLDEYLKSGRVDSDGNPIPVKVSDEREANYLAIKIQGQKDLENLVFQYHRQWFKFGTYDGWAYAVPDQKEDMQNNRDIFAISYQSPMGSFFRQEILTRLQMYHQYYNLRPIPDNGEQGKYPDGASELLDTTTYDLFLRYQVGFRLPLRMDLLFGSENMLFYYPGDRTHYANFDPNHPDYLPFLASQGHPDVLPGDENSTRDLPPFLEPVANRPVLRNSVYMQWISGQLFGKHVQLTLGGRYDRFATTYHNVDEDEDVDLLFQNISPRLALILMPTERLSFKLLAGQAFRDPAPIELFAKNSWVAASNAENLKPEVLRSGEFIVIWEFIPNWLLQNSTYYIDFLNLISYNTGGTNLLENLNSQTNAGNDLEVFYRGKNLQLSFGYSFVRMLDFTPISPDISDQEELADAPAHSLRLSFIWEYRTVLIASTYAYHHEVKLSSPLPETSPYYGQGYKPEILPAFHHVVARGVLRFSKKMEAGVEVHNLLNQEQYTIFTGETPYLYRREMRWFLFYFRLLL
ncbi:MAG: TonB-dependent receptor [Leptospiraceae bacterium]|nr:TonB-dependent receptor [Leptospiraceae bacterium]MDW8306231.1 TonB-dependent receptor [Leptospiraceae bacterium]